MTYTSSKTYGHEVGLSCCFRQWRAPSHCRFLHGYALRVSLWFRAEALDANGWVMDFGGLKPVKAMLEDMFDHKTVVAEDDPDIAAFRSMESAGLVQLRVATSTGCEAFAADIMDRVGAWLRTHHPRVALAAVEVGEHAANSARVDA